MGFVAKKLCLISRRAGRRRNGPGVDPGLEFQLQSRDEGYAGQSIRDRASEFQGAK